MAGHTKRLTDSTLIAAATAIPVPAPISFSCSALTPIQYSSSACSETCMHVQAKRCTLVKRTSSSELKWAPAGTLCCGCRTFSLSSCRHCSRNRASSSLSAAPCRTTNRHSVQYTSVHRVSPTSSVLPVSISPEAAIVNRCALFGITALPAKMASESVAVVKHSVHTLVFRSLKRTHDMFLSEEGQPVLEDEAA